MKVVSYDQVRTVLKKRCGACHAGSQLRGELDLSSWSGIQAGSVSGPVVVAGKPDESMLYTLSAHLDAPKMPPNSPKIPQRELDLIHRWIEGGLQRGGVAGDPAQSLAVASTTTSLNAVRELPRPSAAMALAMSPDGQQVATSGIHQVLIFNSNTGEFVQAFPFGTGDVQVLKYCNDEAVLLAAGGIGAVEGFAIGYDLKAGKELFKVGDESDVALAADYSPGLQRVALGGPGRTVNVYDVQSGARLHTLRRHTDWILSLAFSPDGLLLASGDRFGGLQVWEVASGKEFYTLRGHTNAVTAVQWLGSSDRLLSTSEDGTVRIWDMHAGEIVHVFEPGLQGILAASTDSQNNLYVGARGGQIALLDQQGQMVQRASLPAQVVELGVSRDGTKLAAADGLGKIAVFSTAELDSRIDLKVPVSPELAKVDVILPAQRVRPQPVAVPAAQAKSDTPSELLIVLREVQTASALLQELRAATTRCEQKLDELERRLTDLEEKFPAQPGKP